MTESISSRSGSIGFSPLPQGGSEYAAISPSPGAESNLAKGQVGGCPAEVAEAALSAQAVMEALMGEVRVRKEERPSVDATVRPAVIANEEISARGAMGALPEALGAKAIVPARVKVAEASVEEGPSAIAQAAIYVKEVMEDLVKAPGNPSAEPHPEEVEDEPDAILAQRLIRISPDYQLFYGDEMSTDPEKLKEMMAKIYPKQPFMGLIFNNNRIFYRFSNHHRIVSPDCAALALKVNHYFVKYQIVIRIANAESLEGLLAELSKNITKPTYVGILYQTDEEHSHIITFLCYFSGKGKEGSEFLIMDSVGAGMEVERALKEQGYETIYITSKKRQVDHHSCRTDGLLLLRNSLLSLKYHKAANGFKEALRAARLKERDQSVIEELPPEWDYTSQISNKSPHVNQAKVIRSLYSKKVEKRRKALESVEEFRERHSREIPFTYKIRSYDPKVNVPLIRINLPNGITTGIDKISFFLTFTHSKKVNMYLVDKAEREWAKVRPEQAVRAPAQFPAANAAAAAAAAGPV